MRMLILAGLVGCGGDGEMKHDASAAQPDTFVPQDAAACNSLAQTGPEVVQQRVNEDPPTPTGGTIPDGRYHLVTDSLYTGPNGPTGPTGLMSRRTTSCVNLVCQLVSNDTNGSARETLTNTINGTMITIVQTCPAGTLMIQGSFSTTIGATTTVDLAQSTLIGTRVLRYELQP